MSKLIYDNNQITKEEKQITKSEFVSEEWKLGKILDSIKDATIDLGEFV